MRRYTIPAAIALAFLSTIGCSKPSTVVSDGNGATASVSKDGNKVTYTDKSGKTSTVETNQKDGTVTMKDDSGTSKVESGKSVSEADLGMPFYPGSVEKLEGSFKAESADERDTISVRTTTDDPLKVAEFYKGKIQQASVMSMGDDKTDRQMVTGVSDAGAKVTVTAFRAKGQKDTEVTVGTGLKLKK